LPKHQKHINTLPPLQKKIVLHLAKNGAQTINETVKQIKHNYRPSWTAFNSLEQKGILRKGKMKFYRGRKFPLYWLTEEGIITALVEKASPIDLRTNAKQVYPDNQNLQYYLDMAPYIPLNVHRMFLDALKTKGKLDSTNLAPIIVTQMQTDTTHEKLHEALEIMRKYPTEYQNLKERISYMQSIIKTDEEASRK
jgi:hypothetical protein